jgi:glyoxalase superfamily protein
MRLLSGWVLGGDGAAAAGRLPGWGGELYPTVLPARPSRGRDRLRRSGPLGAVLGQRARVCPRWPSGRAYQGLVPADGQGIEILLQRVPEVKSGKNRLHLDLRTADLDAEVERVVALGGSRLTSKPVTDHGWRWHILADPDGNEFCILQPPTAYWERQPPGT